MVVKALNIPDYVKTNANSQPKDVPGGNTAEYVRLLPSKQGQPAQYCIARHKIYKAFSYSSVD